MRLANLCKITLAFLVALTLAAMPIGLAWCRFHAPIWLTMPGADDCLQSSFVMAFAIGCSAIVALFIWAIKSEACGPAPDFELWLEREPSLSTLPKYQDPEAPW